jgi:hypothetical protein
MMTLRIMGLIVTLSITTYGMTTLSMTSSFVMLNVVNAEHLYSYAENQDAECHYANCHCILRVLVPNEWTGFDQKEKTWTDSSSLEVAECVLSFQCFL